ncbi:MAG TPA: phage tail sheath C-terminal domain-containing protein [Fimbriimonadaceae bacterium]|nr:phage tail sheath C-terminal domain-containing protein [Fimbriimonadaceae bacterium]
MPEYLAPGVFVEEIDSGSKPIEGVGVNTAAFIGYAKSGEFNKPTFISNWSDFCRTFGEDDEIILSALSDELGKSTVELLAAKRASRKSLLDFAQQAIVKAAHDRKAAGVKASDKSNTWSDFVKKFNIPLSPSPYMEDSYLAYAVRGYYDNGGGRAYIIRVAREGDLDLFKKQAKVAPTPALNATLALGGYTFKALEAGADGNNVKVEIRAEGEGDGFTMKITGGDGKTETFGDKKPLTPGSVKSEVKSKIVDVSVATETATRPDTGVFNLVGGADATSATALASLPLNNDLARVDAEDFVGDEAKRSGLLALSVIDDVNFIAIPDLMAGCWKKETLVGGDAVVEVLNVDEKRKQQILDVQSMLISYCERMGDRCCILDPIPGLNPQEMRDTTMAAPFSSDHGQAAIYYPWIKVMDKINPLSKRQIYCPPSGHIAGVWARVGTERGVHKAPANESLMGAVALETYVTKGEQEILNPNGINAIRSFPGTGIRVWGARTLATVGNPSWKYVNVRRLFNYLEKSMERGMQWVVFEPNDHDLWGRVRRNLSAFLWMEWKEGKLFGQTPEEAFYVKCDEETNTQESIDLGRLYVEIGVNPVKPAEFVIIRIGQWSGGGDKQEL